MWDFLKNLRDLLSLDYRSLFIVAIISWFFVLTPIRFWSSFSLNEFYVTLRPWSVIIAVVASLWLMSGAIYDTLVGFRNALGGSLAPRRMQRGRGEILNSTSRVEREVLATYLANDTTTLAFDFRNGIVNGLIKKGILYHASQGTNPLSYDFDTNIHPWAYEYINAHPELFENIKPLEM
jgi:hypothetical protein